MSQYIDDHDREQGYMSKGNGLDELAEREAATMVSFPMPDIAPLVAFTQVS
jgi:hypothetical protein